MVRHSERPTKIWVYEGGTWDSDDSGYYEVFPCDSSRIYSLEQLQRKLMRLDLNPSICRECAVRLGLEW